MTGMRRAQAARRKQAAKAQAIAVHGMPPAQAMPAAKAMNTAGREAAKARTCASRLPGEDRIAARRRVFETYRTVLGDIPGVTFMPEAPFGRANRWLTVMIVDPQMLLMNPLAPQMPGMGAAPEQSAGGMQSASATIREADV